jgi:hypothetical protein
LNDKCPLAPETVNGYLRSMPWDFRNLE